MSGPGHRDGHGPHDGESLPRVPNQRDQSAYPGEAVPALPPPPDPPRPPAPSRPSAPQPHLPLYDHSTLKSLLGAWALAVCSRDEALAVEVHLTDCAGCADEALRLRDAVRLLHREESLDLDPLLRARVLEGCLGRRPARIPVPGWASPYDAEAARLDALLRDLGDGYWKEPVELRWYDDGPVAREATVGQVITHLTAVDGLVASTLGLPAPSLSGTPAGPADAADAGSAEPGDSGAGRPGTGTAGSPHGAGGGHLDGRPLGPWERTEALWSSQNQLPGADLRALWREQSHTLVRTVSFAGGGIAGIGVGYGRFTLPLRDAFVDRAFECWIHASDIAEAVAYPYDPPAPRSMHRMIDLAARMLPSALADRRRAGLTTSASRLVAAGAPGRSLLLEIEGAGGGEWHVSLDSPGAVASPDEAVAHVALDAVEFCQLAAGHLEPERIAVGQRGDRDAIRDVLYATASLSRL